MCSICNSKIQVCTLPPRFLNDTDPYFDLCVYCLDTFLYVYPNLFKHIQNRETGGHTYKTLSAKKKNRISQ
jgi:hypothetical protein